MLSKNSRTAYTKEFDRKNYPTEYHHPNVARYVSRNALSQKDHE